MTYSDTPAHGSGVKNAHIFVGTESKLTDVFGARDGTAQTFLEVFAGPSMFLGSTHKINW